MNCDSISKSFSVNSSHFLVADSSSDLALLNLLVVSLATIPSFHGYYMKGGALEVGQASTVSFVWTSVVIILMNFILTQLLLS